MIFFEFITDDTLYPNKEDLRKKVKSNAKEQNVSFDRCMRNDKRLTPVNTRVKAILKTF